MRIIFNFKQNYYGIGALSFGEILKQIFNKKISPFIFFPLQISSSSLWFTVNRASSSSSHRIPHQLSLMTASFRQISIIFFTNLLFTILVWFFNLFGFFLQFSSISSIGLIDCIFSLSISDFRWLQQPRLRIRHRTIPIMLLVVQWLISMTICSSYIAHITLGWFSFQIDSPPVRISIFGTDLFVWQAQLYRRYYR